MQVPNNAPIKVWYMGEFPPELVRGFFGKSSDKFNLTYITSKAELDKAMALYVETEGKRLPFKPDIILLGNIWGLRRGEKSPMLDVADIFAEKGIRDVTIVPFSTSGNVIESNKAFLQWSETQREQLSRRGITVRGLGNTERTQLNPLLLFFTGGGEGDPLESLLAVRPALGLAPVLAGERAVR